MSLEAINKEARTPEYMSKFVPWDKLEHVLIVAATKDGATEIYFSNMKVDVMSYLIHALEAYNIQCNHDWT